MINALNIPSSSIPYGMRKAAESAQVEVESQESAVTQMNRDSYRLTLSSRISRLDNEENTRQEALKEEHNTEVTRLDREYARQQERIEREYSQKKSKLRVSLYA